MVCQMSRLFPFGLLKSTQLKESELKSSNLLSFNYIELHSFSVSNTAKIFPGVVLFDCSLQKTHKYFIRETIVLL